MWVGGQAVAVDLLTEIIELLLTDATLEEGARVNAGGRVALKVNEVSFVVLVWPAKEIVETDVVERGRRGKGGDMTANAGIAHIGAHNHRHRVPAHDPADLPLHEHITRHPVFAGRGNGVFVGGVNGG